MARFFSRNRSILKYLGKLNQQKSFTTRLSASNQIQSSSLTREQYKANEDAKILDSATVISIASTIGGGVTPRDAIINLPSSGLTAGDTSAVFIDSNTVKYYISNGTGWYNVTFDSSG